MTLYIHHVPGRLRLQTPLLRGRPRAARSAYHAAVAITGVTHVRANTTTGSLLINYDRQRVTPAMLWQALCEHGVATGPLPIADGAAVTRTELRYAAPAAEKGFFDLVAGVFLDKLLEHSAAALVGALI